MIKETITLSLRGDIPLDLFAEVMGHFSSLVNSLSDDIVGSEQIEWQIADLEAGSATATIRGIYHDAAEIERVVRAYESVGRSLEGKKAIPYSENVAKSAYALTGVINGHITAVEFSTDEVSVSVSEHYEIETAEFNLYSLGVITGIVEAIWKRPNLRLGVYDSIFNKIVYCHLEGDQHEIARRAWGKTVAVTGMIKRDFETGRPFEVRQVRTVEIQESSVPGSYKQARGALSWREGDEPAEVLIRRVRNGIE